jgi:aspartyl-tRNA(Asn)/glutamyl-tRNA(Gln) amidotransferase subunit A
MTDLKWLTASEIAAAYRAKRLSPVELTQALIAEIEAHNGDCGAFIRIDPEGALASASHAENDIAAGRSLGPLHGIPVGVKDNIDFASVPTTCHSKVLLDNIAERDAACVANLRGAGAIMLGKQSLHEFAFGGPSKELPFPFARHPWNTDYHPGGSSSGSGVALAAGFVPLSVGTDAGGSIRNPAGNCGVVGLKPTYNLVSRHGVFPVAFTLDHVGPMARSVADVALLLDGLVGGNLERSYGAHLDRGVKGLRIGFVRRWHQKDMVADPEVMEALDEV